MLTNNQIKHIASLAKLQLTVEEEKKFSSQLSSVLDFFGQLQKVDTKKIPETSQVTGLKNVSRKDEIEICEDISSLLRCSPHDINKNS